MSNLLFVILIIFALIGIFACCMIIQEILYWYDLGFRVGFAWRYNKPHLKIYIDDSYAVHPLF